jgi:hypothetical protein
MNEYQRQAYLSALSVENYMPRWRLAIAPEPVACVLPHFQKVDLPVDSFAFQGERVLHQQSSGRDDSLAPVSPIVVADVLRDLAEPKRPTPNTIATISSSSLQKPVEIVQPFALSIWRPKPGLLIIDSRNAQLALPTELLLVNILHALFGAQAALGREEVLRWPLVENTAVSRTEEDARNALQVWLEVELERRPADHLLLFGKNAAQYFLSAESNYPERLWQWQAEQISPLQKMVAPSLVELLQQPLLKRNLWQCLGRLRTSV